MSEVCVRSLLSRTFRLCNLLTVDAFASLTNIQLFVSPNIPRYRPTMRKPLGFDLHAIVLDDYEVHICVTEYQVSVTNSIFGTLTFSLTFWKAKYNSVYHCHFIQERVYY